MAPKRTLRVGRVLLKAGLRIRHFGIRLLTHADADGEDNRRRLHLGISLTMAYPVTLTFGIVDVLVGAREGFVALGMSTVILLILLILRRIRHGLPIFRGASFLLGAMALFYLWRGQFGGATSAWIYPFPLAIFFLLGRREGVVWVGLALALSTILFATSIIPGTYPYDGAFAARSLISLILVSAFSFFFESLRLAQYRRVARQNVRLNALLQEVRTLTGLLPMCANCKRVRDDRGYWDQVENYISKTSSTRVSHAICPDCARELYGIDPGQYQGSVGPEVREESGDAGSR